MKLTEGKRVFSLEDENENFSIKGTLEVEPNGTPTFNGRVTNRQDMQRGYTVYYSGLGSSVSLSMSGCVNCELASTGFVHDTIAKAIATLEADERKAETAEDADTEPMPPLGEDPTPADSTDAEDADGTDEHVADEGSGEAEGDTVPKIPTEVPDNTVNGSE